MSRGRGERLHAVSERRRLVFRVVPPEGQGRTVFTRDEARRRAAECGGRVLRGVITWVDDVTGAPVLPEEAL